VSALLARARAVLAAIGVVVLLELGWDLAHGSAGTHWVLKLTVIAVVATGFFGTEVFRRLGMR
jgi:hypothetical protein